MGIFNIFIVSKSGGLIYHYDHNLPQHEVEKTFGFPLDIKLDLDHPGHQRGPAVVFGQRDGILCGHVLMAVNGVSVQVQKRVKVDFVGMKIRTKLGIGLPQG